MSVSVCVRECVFVCVCAHARLLKLKPNSYFVEEVKSNPSFLSAVPRISVSSTCGAFVPLGPQHSV